MNDNEVSDDVLPTSLSGSDVSDGLDRLMRARITPEMHMQCKVCWFVYDPEEGLPEFGIEPGTPFNDLPEDWTCPECGHPKASFIPAEAFCRALQGRGASSRLIGRR